MLSWIFRHRARLRVLYGLAPAITQVTPAAACALAETSSPALLEAPAPSKAVEQLAPGEWARRSSYLLLRPMHHAG